MQVPRAISPSTLFSGHSSDRRLGFSTIFFSEVSNRNLLIKSHAYPIFMHADTALTGKRSVSCVCPSVPLKSRAIVSQVADTARSTRSNSSFRQLRLHIGASLVVPIYLEVVGND